MTRTLLIFAAGLILVTSQAAQTDERKGAAGAIRNLGGKPDHNDHDESSPAGRDAIRIGAGGDGSFREGIDGFAHVISEDRDIGEEEVSLEADDHEARERLGIRVRRYILEGDVVRLLIVRPAQDRPARPGGAREQQREGHGDGDRPLRALFPAPRRASRLRAVGRAVGLGASRAGGVEAPSMTEPG